MLVLDHIIKYDSGIYNILLRNYIEWCQFVINSYKNQNFISEIVGESIYIMRRMIIYLNDQNNLPEENPDDQIGIYNTHQSIVKIIDMYHNFNYSTDESKRSIISAIHSRFWNFREFDLKNTVLPDDKFISKIDQIILKTEWANTYVTKVSEVSLLRRVVTTFMRLLGH